MKNEIINDCKNKYDLQYLYIAMQITQTNINIINNAMQIYTIKNKTINLKVFLNNYCRLLLFVFNIL